MKSTTNLLEWQGTDDRTVDSVPHLFLPVHDLFLERPVTMTNEFKEEVKRLAELLETEALKVCRNAEFEDREALAALLSLTEHILNSKVLVFAMPEKTARMMSSLWQELQEIRDEPAMLSSDYLILLDLVILKMMDLERKSKMTTLLVERGEMPSFSELIDSDPQDLIDKYGKHWK